MTPRELVGVAVLICTVSPAACTRSSAVNGADSTATKSAGAAFTLSADQRARIHIVTAKISPFNPTVEATGTVAFNGDRSTAVLAPISGPATHVLVTPGTVVRRGEALATVSSPDFAAALATFRKAQSAWRNTTRIAALDSQLYKNDALARRDLEQAQTDAASAAADRDAAMQQMRALGVEEAQIVAIRDNKPIAAPLQAVIRAPIDGTVVEKLISDGQLLQAGTTQCFTIADLSTVWVNANVFAQDLKDVTLGETADVITDASQAPISGRVAYVAALVDPSSRAIGVRILAPNPGHVLRRDMFVKVALHATHEHSGILVPTSSILRDEQNLPFVFVVTPSGGYVRRRITLGSRVGDQYEIPTGINAGDRVVADGALFIQFAETQ